ncbi:MAG: hypothetical protein WC123_05965 [Bacilli bacterium]
MKNGSALLYVVLAILIFSSILSFVFSKTSNGELLQLTYIKEIEIFYDDLYNEQYPDMIEAFTPATNIVQ